MAHSLPFRGLPIIQLDTAEATSIGTPPCTHTLQPTIGDGSQAREDFISAIIGINSSTQFETQKTTDFSLSQKYDSFYTIFLHLYKFSQADTSSNIFHLHAL